MGEITLALTDAASDELERFVVDVRDVEMHRLDGSTVSVMQQAARVDFVELRSLTEVIAGASVPAGRYSRITMTLDFTNADIVLVGQAVPATVLDPEGNILVSTVDVTIDLQGGARPFVGASRRHVYLLDLDLDQAILVDSGLNQVTFSPVFDATIDPSAPKPVLLQGTLDSVDAEDARIRVDRLAAGGVQTLGTFTVQLSATTIVQIDGQVQADLQTALTALPVLVGQRVHVQGALAADGTIQAVGPRDRPRVCPATARTG